MKRRKKIFFFLEKENLNSPTLSNSSENDGIYDNKSYKKASYTKLASKKNSIRSPSLINSNYFFLDYFLINIFYRYSRFGYVA